MLEIESMKQKVLWAVACLLLICIGELGAQQYDILKSSGEIPEEFVTRSTYKAEQDIQKLDKAGEKRSRRKQKTKFYVQSNFIIDRLLKSGKVLFNDSISQYVQKVADNVLKDEPKLRKELRFYVVKSPYVNAFTTDNGIIFINVGLMAQLENEAQLAFILCHEIAHYVEGHSMEGYLQDVEIDQGSGDYNSMSMDQKLLSKSNFSKLQELEADELGFKRFEKSGYSVKAADDVFFVLKFAHLPFDEVPFESTYLGNDYYDIPASAMLDELDPIEFTEDEDDSYSTHPNVSTRMGKLKRFIDSAPENGQDFLVSESSFKHLQKLARYEMTRLFVINGRYSDALYNSFLLEKNYPGNPQNEIFKINALVGIAAYKNSFDLYDVCTPYEDLEGESQQLSHILEELSSVEMSVIAAQKAFAGYKKNPKSEYLKTMARSSIFNLVEEHEIGFSDFSVKPKESDTLKTEVADDGEKNKYDKLREKMGVSSESKPYLYSFSNYMNDRDLIDFFDDAEQELLAMEEEEPYNKKEKNQGMGRLNIDKILLTQAFYFHFSERGRSEGMNLNKSEASQVEFIDDIKDLSDMSGLDVEVFSPYSLDRSEVDRFNDYAILNDWLYEAYNNKEYNIPSGSYELANRLKEEYNTRYIAIAGGISIKEDKSEDLWRACLYTCLVYTAPFALYYIIRPANRSFFVVTVYDLDLGQPVETFSYEYKTRDYKYLSKSSIYDAFLKIKNL